MEGEEREEEGKGREETTQSIRCKVGMKGRGENWGNGDGNLGEWRHGCWG